MDSVDSFSLSNNWITQLMNPFKWIVYLRLNVTKTIAIHW